MTMISLLVCILCQKGILKITKKMPKEEIRDQNIIDHSFLTYKKESKEYGYEVGKISMKEKKIIFNKI